MKKSIVVYIFLIACLPLTSKAQYSFGAGITPGLGFLRSGQLKQAGAVLNDRDSEILNYDYSFKAVFNMGFHGVAQYRLSHQWSVLAMPGIHFFRATNKGYFRSTLDGSNGDYYQYKIDALAKIRSVQFVLPIMAKYYIIPDRPYFVTGGLQFTLAGKSKLVSEEDSITSYYTLGELYSSTSRNYSYEHKLENSKMFQMHLSLGAGASILTGYFHNVDIQLNWLIPLTSSYYYTSDNGINEATLLNSVYGEQGKQAMEVTTGKDLDKFRAGILQLSIRYLFYNQVK